MKKIRIKLKSFDYKLLDRATKNIVDTMHRAGASFNGPIPLPRCIEKFVVNRSPHVYKKAREQFEIRVQKRLIIINTSTPHVIDLLKKIDLAAGIDVTIEVN